MTAGRGDTSLTLNVQTVRGMSDCVFGRRRWERLQYALGLEVLAVDKDPVDGRAVEGHIHALLSGDDLDLGGLRNRLP